MTKLSFADLGLIEPLQHALKKLKHDSPTPIQAEAIPHLLKGADLLGSAQTGTGKTGAFALPTLQRLHETTGSGKKKSPRALVLTPTRELANQVAESFRSYGRYMNMTMTVVYGGVSIRGQIRSLARPVDVLVATPGRLLDLMNQRLVFLDRLEIFTLDEADRMLDMGFIIDIKKIIKEIPDNRQTLFFSATMPKAGLELANSILSKPVHVAVNPVSSTAEKVEQKLLYVNQKDKEALLLSLLKDDDIKRALIFTRTKHKANKIAERLNKNRVHAEAIHGNKSQSAREQALRKFSNGKVRVLVATDVASRGIDVKDISHVINFEMPNEAESYIHRIGRTARAGQAGVAISFCDANEKEFLRDIERTTKTEIPVYEDHPYHSLEAATARGNGKKTGFRKRPNFKQRRRRNSFQAGRR